MKSPLTKKCTKMTNHVFDIGTHKPSVWVLDWAVKCLV